MSNRVKNLNSTPITSNEVEKFIGSLVKRAKNFATSNHLLDEVISDDEIIKHLIPLQHSINHRLNLDLLEILCSHREK